MSYPSKTSVEAIFNSSYGDTLTIYTATEGTADTYGDKGKTFSSGTTSYGRFKIIGAREAQKELGILKPGDAIAYLKLTATIAATDEVLHNSIRYAVVGIMQKKTHLEVALKRLT